MFFYNLIYKLLSFDNLQITAVRK